MSKALLSLCAAALVVSACAENGPSTAPDTSTSPPAGESIAPDRAPYNVGMYQDMATDNWWAYLVSADAWTSYVLSGTACQLYQLTPPNFTVTPQIAAHDWPQPEPAGDGWRVEVRLHDGIAWSDGTPITAHDMVFTWETVQSMPLGGQWLAYYEPAALDAGIATDVVAIDAATVRIEFADRPGLGTWPMTLGLASIMPQHFWEPIIESASDVEAFLATSGVGAPSCGPFELVEREPGAFARVHANDHWFLADTTYTHYADGTVHMRNSALGIDERFGATTGIGVDDVVASYTTGPHLDDVVYSVFASPTVAVGALIDGEIAYLLPGPGLDPGEQDRIFDDPHVDAVINPNYTMQFLGFNFERAPMNDPAFRQAVATVIDRRHITDTVMGGAALPLYTRMPPGNTRWYNEEVGGEITHRWDRFANQAERVDAAVRILADAGYEWEIEPVVDLERGEIIERGRGIVSPDGTPIDRLEVLHPTVGYHPLRNAAGLFIAQFVADLGFEVVSVPTEFGRLVSRVIDPSNLDYDMAVLGWFLGNPALPVYYGDFWVSDAPVNITGYRSDEFDDAAQRFAAATDLADAYDILWGELEPILDRDLPYIPLFDTPLVEGYRPDLITLQYSQVLGGLANVNGMRDTAMSLR